VDCFADILSLVVALRLLGRVSLCLNFHSLSFLLRQVVLDQGLVVCNLLFVRQVVGRLVLLDHLLEGMGVQALLLVVAKDHALRFYLVFRNHFVVLGRVGVLLKSEFFNAIAVHLEFRKLVVGQVFISRNI